MKAGGHAGLGCAARHGVEVGDEVLLPHFEVVAAFGQLHRAERRAGKTLQQRDGGVGLGAFARGFLRQIPGQHQRDGGEVQAGILQRPLQPVGIETGRPSRNGSAKSRRTRRGR